MEDRKHPVTQTVEPPAHPESSHKIRRTSLSKRVSLTVALMLLVLAGAGGYLLFSRNHTPMIAQTAPITVPASATPAAQPTPVVSPVTQANVDQTLNNTDVTMQQSINQADTDLNQINSIDKTQDSTNGL